MVSNLCIRNVVELSGKADGRHTFEITPAAGESFEIKNTEVPVVRYQFGEINNDNLEFISNFKRFFDFSAHVIDFFVSDGFWGDFASQKAIIERIRSEIGAAVILHLRIDDSMLGDGEFSIPAEAKELQVDRVMLDDYSTSMDVVTAAKINKQIAAAFGMQRADVGICGGPLAVVENCCITAERARAWLAKYAVSKEDVIKVSSKQQDMTECGCLRHIVVSEIKVKEKFSIAEYNKTHRQAGAGTKKKVKAETTGEGIKKEPKEKKEKAPKKVDNGWIDMGGLF